MDATRRRFLQTAALVCGPGAVGVARSLNPEAGWPELSASEAVERMRHGDLSAEAYAQQVLRQCAARQDLNAFINMDAAQVLEGARQADLKRRAGKPLGTLHGLPIPVKDSINTHSLPTTSGTGALRNFRPAQDAPLVRRLLSSGALLLGKTNLMELSLGWTSNNKIFGAVHNPYDLTRIPGGSSGGSAAAVAGRIAPLAVGEDTLGSIRVPAALCGICGLRPSVGRYPADGVMPITPRWDAPGPMARQVRDLILFDAAFHGHSAPLRASRAGGRARCAAAGVPRWCRCRSSAGVQRGDAQAGSGRRDPGEGTTSGRDARRAQARRCNPGVRAHRQSDALSARVRQPGRVLRSCWPA